MPHSRGVGGRVARDKVWGVTIRLDYQFLGLSVGFEGQDVSGPESLGPVLTLASAGFWGHCQSVLARSKGKTEGFLGPLELCGLAPLLSAGIPCSSGSADGQKRTDRPRAAVQGLFFVVMVGLVHLSICVIQRGSNSHGFWSGSGGHGGCPSPPPRH